MEEAMEKVIRGAEMTMQNAVLLQHEVQQLRMKNQHQRDKQLQEPFFSGWEGGLTGAKGLQKSKNRRL